MKASAGCFIQRACRSFFLLIKQVRPENIEACIILYNKSMLCPVCKEKLKISSNNKTFSCANGHSFDKARQGYLNLSRKQKASGDNKEMVIARSRFLEKEYYRFLKEAVGSVLENLNADVLCDLGCGQGYYTKSFSRYAKEVYGIDLSKDAIQYAAAHDKTVQYIVGSIYDLPFEDESVDVLVSIFTPIPQKEALRVLKPGGHFIIASPGKYHHYELKDVLYDQVVLNGEPESPEGFELCSRKEIKEKMDISDPFELLEMTPYRYKSSKEAVERVRRLDHLNVTFDFLISDWRKPI